MPWPCDIGGVDPAQFDPVEDLISIIELAVTTNPTNEVLVIDRACNCAINHPSTGPAAHTEWVRVARNRADASNWSGCIQALNHSGAAGPSSPTSIGPTPWPCDTSGNCNAALMLFQLIERANNAAPAGQRELIIQRACDCARHPKQKAGTAWNTVVKHCTWVQLALQRANASQWVSCIDAINHQGGGGNGDAVPPKPIEDLPASVHTVKFADFLAWLLEQQMAKMVDGDKPTLPTKKKKAPQRKKRKKKS
ncbi:MAG: hypothetical protein ACYTGN_12690 [Planctomycetota bacterium]|jgi:hypothetical protein